MTRDGYDREMKMFFTMTRDRYDREMKMILQWRVTGMTEKWKWFYNDAWQVWQRNENDFTMTRDRHDREMKMFLQWRVTGMTEKWKCFDNDRYDREMKMFLQWHVTGMTEKWIFLFTMTRDRYDREMKMYFTMARIKLRDKEPRSEIRQRTKTTGITKYILKRNWKLAEHMARMKDNTWTKRPTEWQIRGGGKRSRGRPSRRWQDDKVY